jgi:hypothetical protein
MNSTTPQVVGFRKGQFTTGVRNQVAYRGSLWRLVVLLLVALRAWWVAPAGA